jgi:hypothetical protein
VITPEVLALQLKAAEYIFPWAARTDREATVRTSAALRVRPESDNPNDDTRATHLGTDALVQLVARISEARRATIGIGRAPQTASINRQTPARTFTGQAA